MFLSPASILLTSCGTDRLARAKSSIEGWPSVFRYNISLTQENPEERARRVDLLRPYLQQQLGIPVEITATVSYGGAIEAMRAKKIEAASMGPFAYLIASEKAGAQAIAARGSADGSSGGYAGTLAVAAGSPIRSIQDLIHHAKDLTLSFVDPASASGYLVERIYLDSIGVNPERDFKKVVFSSNHLASLMTLKAGKADVAAIEDYLPGVLAQRGKLKPGEIRTLWTSPRIPNSPVTVRGDLPEDFKKKVQDAFVEMSTKAPQVFKGIIAKNARPATQDGSYVRVSDAAFDELRKMARGVKQVQLLDH